jgi:HK97 family phage major capsid protein
MRIDDLRAKRDEIDSELALLGNKTVLSRGEQEHWDRTVRQRDKIEAEIGELEERRAWAEDVKRGDPSRYRHYDGANVLRPYDRTTANETTAAALRSIEANASSLSSASLDRMDTLVRSSSPGDNNAFARWVEVHGRPEYASAFGKIAMTGDPGLASIQMNDFERAALHDSFQLRSERAQAEGTSASGGYAIPVFIDPSVILTNQESGNAFLQICRTVDVNTNAWKGVSSAGISWSFDSEASAVSDDSLTSIGQPSVTVFMARGFVPFSIEISEDWPGFQSEMARLLAAGYDELLVDKFSRGSGSGEPEGVLTALAAASPTVIVTSMTDGAFGQEDVFATWKALPQKYRRNASWMMSVDVNAHIRQMGTLTNWFATTVNLTEGAIDRLFARDVFESTYFPSFTGTTGSENRMVLGDWSNLVIARRTGMSVELVPQMLDTSTGRPTGSRGFFAYARIGSNVVNSAAFRMQSNT